MLQPLLSVARRGDPFSLSHLRQLKHSFTWQARAIRCSLQDAAYPLERHVPGTRSLMSAASRASAQLGDGSFPSILVPMTDLLRSAFPHGAEGSRPAWLLAASAGAPCAPASEGMKQWREGVGALELVGLGAAGCSSGSSQAPWHNPGH